MWKSRTRRTHLSPDVSTGTSYSKYILFFFFRTWKAVVCRRLRRYLRIPRVADATPTSTPSGDDRPVLYFITP